MGAENVGEKDVRYRDTLPQIDLLVNHIKALKRIRNCEAARIIFAPEANLPWTAAVQDYLIQSRVGSNIDICTMCEDKNGRPGIRTTNELKGLMIENFRNLLRDKKVKFYRGFISLAAKAVKIISIIIEQLRNYNIYYETGDINKKNKNQKAKMIYGGKAMGSDDMAIATQLNTTAERIFRSRPRYELYR